MRAEPRSALGRLVDSIWINSYHDMARGRTAVRMAPQEKTWKLEFSHSTLNGVCRRITG